MRRLATLMISAAALVLAMGATAVAATFDPLGSSPFPPGSKPCTDVEGAVCSTIQETTDGSHLSVLTVYAPPERGITAFDLWSGTPEKHLRPKSLCATHGTGSLPDSNVGTFYVMRCRERIKPKKHKVYCVSNLSRLPAIDASTTYPLYVGAGDAGAENVYGASPRKGCPPSVAKRKKAKHHHR